MPWERVLRETPSPYPGAVAWSHENLIAVGQERSVCILVRPPSLLHFCLLGFSDSQIRRAPGSRIRPPNRSPNVPPAPAKPYRTPPTSTDPRDASRSSTTLAPSRPTQTTRTPTTTATTATEASLPRADPPAQVHLAPVHARRHPPEPSPRGRRARPRVVPARPRAASCVAVRHPRRRVPARDRILRAPRHRARPAARRVRRGVGQGVRRLGDVRVRRRGGGVAGRRRRRLRPIGI